MVILNNKFTLNIKQEHMDPNISAMMYIWYTFYLQCFRIVNKYIRHAILTVTNVI